MPLELGIGNSHQPSQTRPIWINGNMPAHMTAKMVMASAARLIEVLCQRLRRTSEALEDALLRDAPSRVARGLLRLAATFGRQETKGLRLDIKLSQQQIGNLIGISRESTNKYIVEWTRAGWLSINNGFITIIDREALESLSEAEL